MQWRLGKKLLSFLLALNFLNATLEKLCFFEKSSLKLSAFSLTHNDRLEK